MDSLKLLREQAESVIKPILNLLDDIEAQYTQIDKERGELDKKRTEIGNFESNLVEREKILKDQQIMVEKEKELNRTKTDDLARKEKKLNEKMVEVQRILNDTTI